MNEDVLKKDRNCIHCERLFECKGKPIEVNQCLQFKERREEDGRSQVDQNGNKHL